MKIWSKIKNAVCGNQKMTLKDMKPEQLRREQLGLQNELYRIDMESSKNERTKMQLENDYRAAHEQKKESSKRIVARKLQNNMISQKGIDSRATHANRMYQIVSGVITMKENMEYYEKLGFGKILQTMDVRELEGYINDSFVEGCLQQEKLVTVLGEINHSLSQVDPSSDDIQALMDKLDEKLIEMESPQTVNIDSRENHDLAAINQVVNRGLEVARLMQKQERDSSVNIACGGE